MPRNDLIQLRQGIENQWSFANPILESGEPGYATDIKILKIGDGINGWNSLSSVSQLNVVHTTGDQSIGGTKTFTSQPVFNNGILVGGTNRFTIAAGAAFDFSIDRGNVSEGFTGDVLKFDVDNTYGAGYATTLQSNAPIQHITVRLPDTSGTLALDKRNMIAGSGLVGGGTISADRTFNIGQGDGITVSADSIAVDSNVVVRTTGSQNISGTKTFNNNVIVTGQFSAISGYFKNYLSLNGTGVSISGHTHTVSDITNFGSGVSGLIQNLNVNISGSGNIQVINNSGSYVIGVTGLQLTGSYVSLTGSENVSGTKTFLNNVVVTGQFSSVSGYFRNYLGLNGTGVSITGHTHEIYEINNLQLALNNKQPTGVYVSLTGIESISGTKTFLNNVVVTGQFSSVSGYFKDYLSLNGTGVSITGHTHQIYQISNLQSTLDNKQPTGVYVSLTGVESVSGTKTFLNNIIVTGQFSSVSGYFRNYLSLNGTGVSITGHTHEIYQVSNLQSTLNNKQPTGLYVSLTGIETISGVKTFANAIIATGGIASPTGIFNKLIANGDFELNGSMNINVAASILANGAITFIGNPYVVSGVGYFTSGLFVGPTGNATPVSLSGHQHTYNNISNFCTGVAECVNTPLLAGTGISLSFVSGTGLYIHFTGGSLTISNTGISAISGYFRDYLSLNGTGVSITGHTHQIYEITNLQSVLNNKQPTGVYVSLTGIESISGTKTFLNNVIVTGQFSSVSGYFKDYLSLNGTGVSITGHSHQIYQITNLQSSLDNKQPTGVYVSLTGVESVTGIKTFINNIVATGGLSSTSGYFKDYLSLNGTGVSITGHTHQIYQINNLQSSLDNKQPTGIYVSLTGIESISGSKTFTQPIFATGGISSVSGYFKDYLSLNGSGISLTGHTHTVSDITNFNSGVSGLFPSTLVYTTGTQIITGNKDFGSNLKISASQVTSADYFPTFGSNNPLSTSYALQYITKADLVTSLSFETIDVGNSFVSTTGIQQISGVKTFLSTSSFNGNNSTISSRNSRLMPIGNIMLENSNTNFIVFNDAATGLAPVNSTVFSSGLKILFKPLPSVLGSAPPVAMGISNNALWHVVPANNWQYQWNALSGTIATLFGDGTFNATNISGTNFYLSGIKINSSADDLNLLDTATNGQLLIGSGLSFSKSTLTAGTGISISNGSGTITINTVGLQSTLTNPITGTGTNGKLAKWSSTSTLNDSILSESSTVINIAGSFNGQSDDSYLSFDANARRIGMTKKGGFTGKFTYGSGSSFAIAQSNSGTIEASHTFTDRLVIDTSGNVGIGTATPTYKLQVNGNFGATTKSFRIDHPSKSDYTLEYGSLESPYHGVRLTGRGKVIKGVGMVSVPSYLKDLIYDDDTLNIQITNIKHGKTIYLEEIDLENDRFIVKTDKAKTLADLEFFWTLTGVRKDVDHLVVEKEK